MICNVTLIDSESLDDRTIVQRPSRKNAIPGTGMNENGDYYINLLGNRVALATRLLDPINRNYKYFFNFPDLKVRVRGRYRFNCMIIVPGEGVFIQLQSDVFEVFQANEFKGSGNPTELSKFFANQGVPFKGRSVQKKQKPCRK